MDIDRDELTREPRMWITGKVDQASQKEALFSDLMSECRLAAPGARLSYSLRNRLERLSRDDRRELVSRRREGCTPLFVACKRGNVEIVEYLVTFCDADIEARGQYEVPDDHSVHCVTPLWCASVSGKLPVVKCLVQHGAEVNSVSDTGSTSVRSACFMTHLDIVIYLVENGADILLPNYNGGTCLINSVQSIPLCEYLLRHGAAVNAQDVQHKTALHYAIQEHRFETTKLLLDHGADPFLESRYNDDALQTACLKGATQIFEYLIKTVLYSAERIANAHELIGTTFLDEHHDMQLALAYWRKAAEIRSEDGETPSRKEILPPNPAYQNQTEFQTADELRLVALDLDHMRTQSLLICERILGRYHKDTIFRLMYRGAAYADALQYQRCIDLWRYALELRVRKDSILYSDTCFTAQALVRLFLDLHEKHIARVFQEELHFEDVLAVSRLVVDQLGESQALLRVSPAHKRQQDSFDRTLKCLTHLFHLLLETGKTPQQQTLARHLVVEVVRIDPRACNGNGLLHLAVHRLNLIRSNYFLEEHHVNIFPNFKVAQVLLECGAHVNAVNQALSTPLHVAAAANNFHSETVRLLLDHGAHLDQGNREDERPYTALMANPDNDINLLQYTSLKCLAARVVSERKIPYKGEVPTILEHFIQLHRRH